MRAWLLAWTLALVACEAPLASPRDRPLPSPDAATDAGQPDLRAHHDAGIADAPSNAGD